MYFQPKLYQAQSGDWSTCHSRGSNPGLLLGRHKCNHYTTQPITAHYRYSMIRCAASNIESPNHRITESPNRERISKYSLYRIIESPNTESWQIFLLFDPLNIESPNRFGDRIFNHDSVIRYSVIEYRILRITEYSMVRFPYS